MRNLYVFFGILLFAVVTTTTAQQNSLTFVATTKGIGTTPSFGIEEPAFLVFSDIKVWKNLHYTPDIAFGLKGGGTGWFLDNWLRWIQPIDTTDWSISIGMDWSMFFQPYGTKTGNITQAIRYPAFELGAGFRPDSTQSFSFAYWYVYAIEKDFGVAGHYLSLAYSRNFAFSKNFSIGGKVNPYWISFNDGAQGFAVFSEIGFTHNPSGLFIKTQGVTPISKGVGGAKNSLALGVHRRF